ncbi:hypothetical protein Hdeb2414_s0018g00514481 [Helianthus debilis subsp. tardiflorus]
MNRSLPLICSSMNPTLILVIKLYCSLSDLDIAFVNNIQSILVITTKDSRFH